MQITKQAGMAYTANLGNDRWLGGNVNVQHYNNIPQYGAFHSAMNAIYNGGRNFADNLDPDAIREDSIARDQQSRNGHGFASFVGDTVPIAAGALLTGGATLLAGGALGAIAGGAAEAADVIGETDTMSTGTMLANYDAESAADSAGGMGNAIQKGFRGGVSLARPAAYLTANAGATMPISNIHTDGVGNFATSMLLNMATPLAFGFGLKYLGKGLSKTFNRGAKSTEEQVGLINHVKSGDQQIAHQLVDAEAQPKNLTALPTEHSDFDWLEGHQEEYNQFKGENPEEHKLFDAWHKSGKSMEDYYHSLSDEDKQTFQSARVRLENIREEVGGSKYSQKVEHTIVGYKKDLKSIRSNVQRLATKKGAKLDSLLNVVSFDNPLLKRVYGHAFGKVEDIKFSNVNAEVAKVLSLMHGDANTDGYLIKDIIQKHMGRIGDKEFSRFLEDFRSSKLVKFLGEGEVKGVSKSTISDLTSPTPKSIFNTTFNKKGIISVASALRDVKEIASKSEAMLALKSSNSSLGMQLMKTLMDPVNHNKILRWFTTKESRIALVQTYEQLIGDRFKQSTDDMVKENSPMTNRKAIALSEAHAEVLHLGVNSPEAKEYLEHNDLLHELDPDKPYDEALEDKINKEFKGCML